MANQSKAQNLLTDIKIKAAKPKDKEYTLRDGDGLSLLIKPNGSKLWTIRYTLDGKPKKTTLGNYPHVNLVSARKKRDEYISNSKSGIDLILVKKTDKVVKKLELQKAKNTFRSVADDYFSHIDGSITQSHFEKKKRTIERNILDFIGDLPISDITHTQILEYIKRIEARGAIDLAKRTLSICDEVYRYAVSHNKAQFNIIANIDKKTALKPLKQSNYAHITDTKELSSLLSAMDEYVGDFSTKHALALLPYLFVRPANIRFMEWSEIDFDNEVWNIPANKMKMKTAHIVPLPKQAIKILRFVYQYSCVYKYVFVSPTSTLKPLSENTLNMALKRIGYKDKMVSHGFRHTASTILHENIHTHGFDSLVIEAQLSHQERNSVKAVYNKAEYLPQRVKLMQWYADYLDSIK